MRTEYSEDFKAEAVALALSSEESYSTIARDLGVNYQTFGNWMRAAMSKAKPSSTKHPTKPDYQALEKQYKAALNELDLTKKEVEVLKRPRCTLPNTSSEVHHASWL